MNRHPAFINTTPEMRIDRDARARAYAAYYQHRTAQPSADLMDLAIREWQRYASETETAEIYATLFVSTCERVLRSLAHRTGLRLEGSNA